MNLQCHETKLRCTFLAEILYTFSKRSLSRNKFGEIGSLKFGTLMGSLRQNNIKYQLKRYRRLISHERSLKKKWIVVSNMTWGILWIFTQPLQNFTSMGYFCPKYMRFELKKYGGVIFHDTEQWCKIWINPDLVVSKMNCTLTGSFCPKDIMFQLENFRGIMCHDTEG